MSRTEIINAFSAAMEANDFERAGSYLDDAFTLSGPTPQPVGKHEFLAMQSAFQRAFPDWKFNLHDAEERDDIVTGAVQITGTHTEDLVLPGMPPIPVTYKKISLPEEHLVFTFKGNRIASLASDNVPGGGVAGTLQQIGVPIPAM